MADSLASLKAQYLGWRRSPAVGCAFARYTAGRPHDFDQAIVRVGATGNPKRTAASVARRVVQWVADPDVAAGVVLFAGLNTLKDLTKIVLALGKQPMWKVTTSALENSPAGDMVAVHVARKIPFGSDQCPSEVLLFGPFPEFPSTRRAPICALEIFVGEPMTADPKTGEPTTKANLAHWDLDLVSDRAFQRMWKNSVNGRKKSLGGKDSRAKAKVALVIPKNLAEQLECPP